MKNGLLQIASFLLTTFLFTSCFREADPGTLQSDARDYAISDFDSIEMGEAFDVTVQQGPVFSVHVSGDRRNLDALTAQKTGSTLKIKYNDSRNHNHTTYVLISMPLLVSANLSGATVSTIGAFKNGDNMVLTLTGASVSQVNLEAKKLTIDISGASKLTLSGKSNILTATVNGASELYSYDLMVTEVEANASGASKINVYAGNSLKAIASGASKIYYRGNPVVNSSVSGASTVQSD